MSQRKSLFSFRRLQRVRWTIRRKGWHPNRRKLARLRATYWVLIRNYETEICARCGGPVRLVYHVPDELWMRYCGFPNPPWGVLCPGCFADLAEESGTWMAWECAEGNYPSCAGSPCAHQEAMLVIAGQRDDIWRTGCEPHPEFPS